MLDEYRTVTDFSTGTDWSNLGGGVQFWGLRSKKESAHRKHDDAFYGDDGGRGRRKAISLLAVNP